MDLKKVELIGFKSFADRTELVFDKGITALVGPNGCGKSNIVDAVKWVLGEQSVKSLRGKEMADVIFKGSNGRKPHGYAEASLTFSNNRGLLPVDYEEVCITRRVYRSGEGEYFINREPVRLKDVRRLFMDTGIGMDSYSIIEQGKVDLLLQSTSAERRAIFDEAAGISKYKAQKKESLAKLERVEQNLLRLKDIIDEVEKQLRSVKYQAAKARKYQAYEKAAKELRTRLALHRYNETFQARQTLRKEIAEKAASQEALRKELAELQSRESLKRDLLQQTEEDLQKVRQQLSELSARLSLAEERIASTETFLAELSARRGRLKEEQSHLLETSTQQRSQLELAASELENLERRSSEVELLLDSEQNALSECEKEARSIASQIDSKKALLIDLLQKGTTLHNELGSICTLRKSAERKIEEASGRIATLQAELARLAPQKEEIAGLVDSLEQEIYRTEKHIGQIALQAKRIEHENEERKPLLEATTRKAESLRSQIEMLKQMEARLEGVSPTIRRILKERAHQGRFQEVLGMLADLIDVEPRAATAIESVLGGNAEALVVPSREAIRTVLKEIPPEKRSAVSFIPLDAATPGAGNMPLPPGAIGRASDFVRTENRFSALIRSLLSEVILVEDLEAAFKAAEHNEAPSTIVSLRGDVLEKKAALTVRVAGNNIAPTGLISRRSHRGLLESELEQLEEELARLRNLQEASNSELSRIQAEKEKLRQNRELKINLRHRKERDLDRIMREVEHRQDEIEILRKEIDRLKDELDNLLAREKSIKEEDTNLRLQTSSIESAVQELSSAGEELQRKRSALTERVTQIRVEMAQVEEKRSSAIKRVKALEETLQERLGRLKTVEAEIEEALAKEQAGRSEISENKNLIALLTEERSEVEKTSGEYNLKRDALIKEIEDLHRVYEERSLLAAESSEQIQQLRLKENEQTIRLENLVVRLKEEYGLDLEALYQSAGQPAEEVDAHTLESEIAQLREKMQRLGNVNLDAIAEQDSLQTRADFLNNQYDDLLKARASLQETIRRINRTSRELFEKTFEGIRLHFSEIFRKLFGGGKADILLEDPDNILESGIEILAKPPGKQLQVLSLLSGGEKVLTAVALLLAIFRMRPSPFCILDEVDAALDESNIQRFLLLLQEFLKDSQFIIITHNKQTMNAADVIYGITMSASGATQKVAVNFRDISDKEGQEFFRTIERLAATDVSSRTENAGPPSKEEKNSEEDSAKALQL